MTDRLHSRKRRVLIVDDEPDVLETYGDLLRSAGFEVNIASDAVAGLALAMALRPAVVLVDQKMPKIGGRELALALLTEVDPPPRVILITAYPTVEMGEPGAPVPFRRVLFKPVSSTTLLQAINAELTELLP